MNRMGLSRKHIGHHLSSVWDDYMNIACGKGNLAQEAEQAGDQREHGKDKQCSDHLWHAQIADRTDKKRSDQDTDQKRTAST